MTTRRSDWRADILKANYHYGEARKGHHRPATCRHCQRYYNSGKPSVLIEHLQKCAKTLESVKQQIMENLALQYEAVREEEDHESETNELLRINYGLAKMFTILNLPANIVDRPAFREWTEKSFGYTPPSAHTLKTTYMAAVAAQVANEKHAHSPERRKKAQVMN